MKIGIVISSTRPTRVGPTVARWIADQAPEGFELDIVDLAEQDLPFLAEPKLPAEGDYTQESTKAWSERVQQYDAMIFAVCEYNGGYSAPLKNAIDTLFAEWNDLPIGLVGYGFGGGARAMKALEPVLSTIKAIKVDGPEMAFGTALTPEGDMLPEAPAAEVRDLYLMLRDRVPARV